MFSALLNPQLLGKDFANPKENPLFRNFIPWLAAHREYFPVFDHHIKKIFPGFFPGFFPDM